MAELKIEIPGLLEGESKRIEKKVGELISSEEKLKSLSLFMDKVMKGAGQLSEGKLIRLGREVKKGRFGRLKQKGLV
ncbi:hypothetical protein KY366_00475 [Candidatus Woesearchaeota archaeon]|nr:hypothetical protein [Candidatus Woesearchaeota archaeon]